MDNENKNETMNTENGSITADAEAVAESNLADTVSDEKHDASGVTCDNCVKDAIGIVKGIITRDALEDDARSFFSYDKLKSLTTSQILSYKPYADKFEKMHENDAEIRYMVDKIIMSNKDGVETKVSTDISFENFNDADDNMHSSPSLRDLRNIYRKQIETSRYYPHYRPTLMQRFVIGFCNLILRPLKIRLYFKTHPWL